MTPDRQARGRLQFLLLATLFFAPLLAACVLYFFFPTVRPEGTVNYGRLVDPARPLPALVLVDAGGEDRSAEALHGRWTMVHLAGADCDARCEARLLMSRQVRTAMNEKRSRVHRLLVVPDREALERQRAQLAGMHPDLQILADEGKRASSAAAFFAAAPQGAILLVDPLGNWMMTYPAGAETQVEFKGMQKDLKKLMRISQVG